MSLLLKSRHQGRCSASLLQWERRKVLLADLALGRPKIPHSHRSLHHRKYFSLEAKAEASGGMLHPLPVQTPLKEVLVQSLSIHGVWSGEATTFPNLQQM